MNNSTIAHRARLVGAGIAILALAPATPSPAAAAPPTGGCCNRPQASPASAQTEYPYSSAGNPLGFKGPDSTNQYAEEGTLHQGPALVDAEVGAGERDVLDVPGSAAHNGAGADWVVQGLLVFVALAVISLSVRLIFLPSDRIPKIGAPRSRTDG